jgi:hypothetical protein
MNKSITPNTVMSACEQHLEFLREHQEHFDLVERIRTEPELREAMKQRMICSLNQRCMDVQIEVNERLGQTITKYQSSPEVETQPLVVTGFRTD